MLALTGLPRLSLTLAEYFGSSPTQETLLARRPLFFDKVSSSQFTLARPEDSAMPWARRLAPESDPPRPDRTVSIVPMPRWQRTLVTAAFWNHTNFV